MEFTQIESKREVDLMRQLLRLVALSAALSGPAVARGGDHLSPQDVEAIRATSKRYVSAMRENDWATVVTFFTPDAARMPPNQPMHRGRAAIQQWLSQIERLTEYEVTLEEIQGSGAFAYAHAKYRITLTLKGMAGPIKDSGKAIEVWRKESDGTWRVASAIWNSDQPIP